MACHAPAGRCRQNTPGSRSPEPKIGAAPKSVREPPRGAPAAKWISPREPSLVGLPCRVLLIIVWRRRSVWRGCRTCDHLRTPAIENICAARFGMCVRLLASRGMCLLPGKGYFNTVDIYERET